MNTLRRRWSAVAVATLMVPVTLLMATPARAHHGYAGPVLLYLESVRLEPGSDEWLLRAGLNDTGSGKAAAGFVVEATGSGPQSAAFGPVTLSDVDADGRYEAGLGALPAGDWSLTLHIGDAPGGEERAVPITRTWTVALRPGEALDVLGRSSVSGGGGSSGTGDVVLPMALIAAVVGLIGLVLAAGRTRRRRLTTTVPAR